jgi:hypothetical protein
MKHFERHPEEVEGCLMCKLSYHMPAAGVTKEGGTSTLALAREGKDPVQKVVKDRRGSHETHHFDGRQDAQIVAPRPVFKGTVREE